jgi:hypothetical protein
MLIQVQDHDTSNLKDYVPRYPANYPEPLWPDGEPIADDLALMVGLDSMDPNITGLPAQANIIEHAGRDENALLPTVAPSEGPEFLYQEPEVRQIVPWGESHASASTDDAYMADQPVPHDGSGFVEEDEVEVDEPTRGGKLSQTFDPAYDSQSLPFSSIPGNSMDREGGETNLLDRYTTTTSNPSTYPESPLFAPRQIVGSTTDATSLSLESTRDAEKSQNDKLCFCEETSNSLDPHFFCHKREQCLCEPCMGWKLWSGRGRDIFGRSARGEITTVIPERRSGRH